MGKSTSRKSNIHTSNIRIGKIRLVLWRWHRRMGLLSALFVILLASTGLLLNHGNDLGLDSRSPPNGLLSVFYGVQSPRIFQVDIDDSSIAQVNARELFLNEQPIGFCRGDLVGGLSVGTDFLIACEQELLFLNKQGELIDKLDSLSGLPQPIKVLGRCDDQPCWQAEREVYSLNLDTMAWHHFEGKLSQRSILSSVPQSLNQRLLDRNQSEITWERVVQDLHSGRLFGAIGPWLMDVMAILFMIIACTGVIMWSLGRRRKA